MKKSQSAKNNAKANTSGPQSGGAFYANGGWASGRFTVGEHGPEVMDIGPSVAHITSNEDMTASGDFDITAPLNINIDSYGVWQGLLRLKKRGKKISLGLA
jgi:hypothetical protein